MFTLCVDPGGNTGVVAALVKGKDEFEILHTWLVPWGVRNSEIEKIFECYNYDLILWESFKLFQRSKIAAGDQFPAVRVIGIVEQMSYLKGLKTQEIDPSRKNNIDIKPEDRVFKVMCSEHIQAAYKLLRWWTNFNYQSIK